MSSEDQWEMPPLDWSFFNYIKGKYLRVAITQPMNKNLRSQWHFFSSKCIQTRLPFPPLGKGKQKVIRIKHIFYEKSDWCTHITTGKRSLFTFDLGLNCRRCRPYGQSRQWASAPGGVMQALFSNIYLGSTWGMFYIYVVLGKLSTLVTCWATKWFSDWVSDWHASS